MSGIRVPQELWRPSPSEIAESAGLRYLTDEDPGWSRRRCGRGFTYLDGDGILIQGSDRVRLHELAVPPAWESVWLAPIADAHLLATGRDQDGRKQYRYNLAFRAIQDELKFSRLAYFGKALRRLRPRIEDQLIAGTVGDHEFALAAATRLIDSGLLRVGNEVYRMQSGAQGATTLDESAISEIDLRTGEVRIEFVGKGGTERDISIEDEVLTSALDDLLDLPEATLFGHVRDGDVAAVTSTALNAYISQMIGPAFSAKDFRTWGGTVAAVEALSTDPDPLKAFDHAAAALGNTRAVARASYVAPQVVRAGEDGSLAKAWSISRSARWMSRAESATEKVLKAAAA